MGGKWHFSFLKGDIIIWYIYSINCTAYICWITKWLNLFKPLDDSFCVWLSASSPGFAKWENEGPRAMSSFCFIAALTFSQPRSVFPKAIYWYSGQDNSLVCADSKDIAKLLATFRMSPKCQYCPQLLGHWRHFITPSFLSFPWSRILTSANGALCFSLVIRAQSIHATEVWDSHDLGRTFCLPCWHSCMHVTGRNRTPLPSQWL